MPTLNRRDFMAGTVASAVLASAVKGASPSANDTVVVALMGANDRGSQLARQIANIPGIEIAYVCDPDERAIGLGIEAATVKGGRKPKGIKDFRKALEDPAIDALICAAPNHWHAPATCIACDAGKHVYVEKPCSHTAAEGEMMIAAAVDNKRVVQVGMQRRSEPVYQKAVEKVRGGALGKALYANSWYCRKRPSIGRGKEVKPPEWLDFDLWQGAATPQPYRDNLLHYNWHFFWHWGDGELGNNGVHTIDICRWVLGVDFPDRVTVAGSKLRFDDDQQTPDTINATFECDGKIISWSAVSWSPPYAVGGDVGIEIRGEDGIMTLGDSGFTIYDNNRKVVEEFKAPSDGYAHLKNFASAVREGATPNAGVVDGHRSALLCHLGNISYRTGESLEIDSTTGKIKDNDTAQKYWACEYRDGWLPKA